MTHTFDIEIAAELGIESAVILSNFTYWIIKNIANGKNIHDGKAWTYNSYEALEDLFPYIKKEKIKRVILALEKDDILVSRTDLNKSKFDKTKWYSFGDNQIVNKLLGDTKNSLNNDVQSSSENSITDGANLHDGECNPAPSIKNNNQRQIKNADKKPDINQKNNIKKDFTFSLTKNTQFKNLSKEYKDKLKAYAVCKDGAYNFQNFLDHHTAKGSKFKNWSSAYNVWINNSIKFNRFNPKNYVTEHYDPVTNKRMLQEYGTNNLYCPDALKFLAILKQQPQQQHQSQTVAADYTSGNINPSITKMMNIKGVC